MVFDSAVLFALGAAISYAFADMAARYGLQNTHPLVGTTLLRVTSFVFLAAIALAAGVFFPPLGMHYFWVIAGGAFNPGLFSVLFMVGISRIGVARAAPIKGSAPLFATLIAIFLLDERPEWYQMGGVIFIAGGIALISSGKGGSSWRRVDVLWPVGAAISSGLGASLWRMGLHAFPEPLAGAAVGSATALVVVAGYSLVFYREKILEDAMRVWWPFLLCGCAAAAGSFFFASALQAGRVFRMVSLIQLSPLLTVLFALIFLRKAEGITWRVPAGAIATVLGAIMVNLRI